ncbi:MAG: LL-diaminopimelate aminotransferase [Candidatus Hydrothermarchaeaceae archaeon]
MELAERLNKFPRYFFAELDKKIADVKNAGKDIIDLGVGDPDIPTPEHIVEACCKAAKKSENHRYPTYGGMLSFRKAVAERYKKDFKLEFDPESEVITLIGSKEGIYNINFAFVDSGDAVLYPNPGYPVYRVGAIFAGGEAVPIPLQKDNDFLPDLEAVPAEEARRAKMLWVNYPNNPTAAVADKDFYKSVVDFASDNDIVVCSDEAYSSIAFDSPSPCFLEVKGARDVGIVFNSLSKTYNMTGWRLAYAVGNEDIIGALGKVKTNVDSGVSQIIQEAGIVALTSSQKCVSDNIKIYRKRRDVLVSGFRDLGVECEMPKATFYVWVEVPDGDSMAFAGMLLEKCSIVCAPGIGFGSIGEGFARFALTQPVSRIKEALERMEKAF